MLKTGAVGSNDTELDVLPEPKVDQGITDVHARKGHPHATVFHLERFDLMGKMDDIKIILFISGLLPIYNV